MFDIMAEENTDIYSIVESVKDETKKKELKATDEEEDFLDEGNDMFEVCAQVCFLQWPAETH
jgi:hypothetical protein